MVNTRKSSQHESCSLFISSRTRSSVKNNPSSDEQHHKDPGSDVSSSSVRLSPPSKRTRRHATPSSSDTSPSPQVKGQRVTWNIPSQHSRLSTESLQNGHGSISRKSQRKEDGGDGDHARMNGHVEVKRSCRSRKSRFEHLNQSRLFDQLVNSTAEAVLQEMDNISSIRQNREVERLRMWTDTELENMDMYSRVKRRRKSLRRNAYGMQTHHKVMKKGEGEEEEGTEESHEEEEEDDDDEVEDDDDDEDDDDEDDDDEDDDDDDEGDEAEEVGEENDRPYNLRQRKTVQRYEAPPIEPVSRKQSKNSLFDTHRSPARRSHIRVKKHAIHSSDTTSSSDEERFERRKSKSMSRARNRCLPMNLRPEDLASGVLRDRVKVGASLADVDPMNLDTSVRFDSVGGLGPHIQALKEMVVFPLLYPEVFEKFKIQPPRGCLFYGPPGTGKTLVARALANECSQGDRKVSFFMRKGADCLSKWVGESERQLRLLFDQAYLMRPSIIFFDEIDGLAPVRSSRQDQIHSSIVSTLLALMDGLDSRGEIVVIGATNRIDSIDPALRRPGRFDREFLFNLPDKKARKHILQIHTREWSPRLAEPFLGELAEKCVGYCGADVKALCTEAALMALRRRYPQIYSSSCRLRLDVESIVLGPQDFLRAMRRIVPASQRALLAPGHALAPEVRPLLERMLAEAQARLLRVFPHAQGPPRDSPHDADNQLLEDLLYSDDEDSSAPSIYDHNQSGSPKKHAPDAARKPFLHFTLSACRQPSSFRPRLLLAGQAGSGQSTHLAPALLHHLEEFSVHRLDLPTLYSVSTKTPEESCAQVFREARRAVPSVVYLPHVSEWWEAVSDTLKSTFLTLLQDLPSFTPILILATSEMPYLQLPEEVRGIFSSRYDEVLSLKRPDDEDRRRFFRELILVEAARAPPTHSRAARRALLEVLSPAEDPGPRRLSEEEQRRLEEQEENTLRELRLFLRDVTKRLATDKRFSVFSKPVDIQEVSDYLEVIRQPMDLSTVMGKIDAHKYLTVKDFLFDIDLICSNALEYNPDKDPGDKIIRHRACSLKDTAHAMFASEMDVEFSRMCEEIKEARRKRGVVEAEPPQAPPPGAPAPRRAAGEEAAGNVQGEAPESSPSKCTNHVKRKARRRPSWGRGIIRKKKSYLKKEETEGEEPDEGAGPEDAAGPGDAPLTQDEDSSCDALDPPPAQNGPEPNGHTLSTEEESSNEPPAPAPDPAPDPTPAPPKEEAPPSNPQPQDCMNGDESLDSLDSEANRKGDGGDEPGPAPAPPTTQGPAPAPPTTQGPAPAPPATQEGGAPEGGDGEERPGEASEGDPDKEGVSKVKRCRKSVCEAKTITPLEDSPPPPLVVDHQRLQGLLEQVVVKTELYTVDQLERLFSILSQCIYQHRRDFDKTHMIEEMERSVRSLDTFL